MLSSLGWLLLCGCYDIEFSAMCCFDGDGYCCVDVIKERYVLRDVLMEMYCNGDVMKWKDSTWFLNGDVLFINLS